MNVNHALRRSVWRLVRGLARRVKHGLNASPLVQRLARPLSSRPTRQTAEQGRQQGQGAVANQNQAANQNHVSNWTTDEKTMRRVAEAQHGGLSSEESAARYARGENPGGTHAFTAKTPNPETGATPVHQRPEFEEPQDRVERTPGGERHMSSVRKAS